MSNSMSKPFSWEDSYGSSACSPKIGKDGKGETSSKKMKEPASRKVVKNLVRELTEGHGSNVIVISDDEEVTLDFSREAIMRRVFNNEGEAEEFYKLYGRVKGFKCLKEFGFFNGDTLQRRKWICARPTGKKEIPCGAKFAIYRNYLTAKYDVVDFVEEHNHEMDGL